MFRRPNSYGFGGESMGWPFMGSRAYFNEPQWDDFAPFYNPFSDQSDSAYENPRGWDFAGQGQYPQHARTCRDCARRPSQRMQPPVDDDQRRNCHGRNKPTRSVDHEEVATRPSAPAVVPPRGNCTPSGRIKDSESFPMEGVREIPVVMDNDSVSEREIPSRQSRGTSNQQLPAGSPCSQPSEASVILQESQQFVPIKDKVTQPPASEDSLPNSNVSDETYAPTIPQIQLLNKIQQDLTNLDCRIRAFQGQKSDREYLTLDELLTRALLSLDEIDSGGVEEVRVQRKKLVQYAYSLVEQLEGRFGTLSATNAKTDDEKLHRDNSGSAIDSMNSDDNAECDTDDDSKVGLANFIDL